MTAMSKAGAAAHRAAKESKPLYVAYYVGSQPWPLRMLMYVMRFRLEALHESYVDCQVKFAILSATDLSLYPAQAAKLFPEASKKIYYEYIMDCLSQAAVAHIIVPSAL